MMLPASKRPFHHPVPAAALDYFVHPRPGHHYAAPAWGRDSKLYCSNGYIAIRFFGFPSSFGRAPMTMVDRLLRLPWRSRSEFEKPSDWRSIDDCTGDLFAPGVLPMWKSERGGFCVDPCVRLNHAALLPLASLQLISRLPKAEIYTVIARGQPIPFRFRGGEGLLATLSHTQEAAAAFPAAHIFPQRSERI